MTLQLGVADVGFMRTGAMSPAVGTIGGCRRSTTATTRGSMELRLVVGGVGEGTAGTAVAGVAIVAMVALVVAMVARRALRGNRRIVGEVFRHLRHEGSAGQNRICEVGSSRKSRFDRRRVENRWRVGVKETLGYHISHGSQHGSIGLMKHVGDAGEGVQVTLGSAEVNEHVGPGFGEDRATMPTEEFLLEDGNLGQDEVC